MLCLGPPCKNWIYPPSIFMYPTKIRLWFLFRDPDLEAAFLRFAKKICYEVSRKDGEKNDRYAVLVREKNLWYKLELQLEEYIWGLNFSILGYKSLEELQADHELDYLFQPENRYPNPRHALLQCVENGEFAVTQVALEVPNRPLPDEEMVDLGDLSSTSDPEVQLEGDQCQITVTAEPLVLDQVTFPLTPDQDSYNDVALHSLFEYLLNNGRELKRVTDPGFRVVEARTLDRLSGKSTHCGDIFTAALLTLLSVLSYPLVLLGASLCGAFCILFLSSLHPAKRFFFFLWWLLGTLLLFYFVVLPCFLAWLIYYLFFLFYDYGCEAAFGKVSRHYWDLVGLLSSDDEPLPE